MAYDIQRFLKYLNINSFGSNDIQVVHYDEHPDILLQSEPIEIDFYFLSVKQNPDVQPDFENASGHYLYIDSPGNTISWNMPAPPSGYCILVNGKWLSKAATYSFMKYNNHEALYLTSEEKEILYDLFKKSYYEFSKANYSNNVLLSYASLILSYAQSFYERQFKSLSKLYNKVVADFYYHLEAYFKDATKVKDHPSVMYFAQKANLSINYFGDVIKHFTGASPSEHIHRYIIDQAKQKLRNTNLSVSEIAFSLGFEYPNYFARFFRQKTGIAPTVFRKQ